MSKRLSIKLTKPMAEFIKGLLFEVTEASSSYGYSDAYQIRVEDAHDVYAKALAEAKARCDQKVKAHADKKKKASDQSQKL